MAIATLPLAGRGSYQRTPPFRGDALRPLGLHHAAGDAPPGEACRRSFGNLGEHVERLGLGKSRQGRGGLAGHGSDHGDAPASADRVSCARSGIWLSREKSRRTAAPLNRLAKRSISGSCLPLSSLLAKAVWAGSRGSVASAASTIRSTPKPTSMAQTLSSNRRARCDGSRHGALRPAVDDGRGAVGAIDRKLQAPRAAAGEG